MRRTTMPFPSAISSIMRVSVTGTSSAPRRPDSESSRTSRRSVVSGGMAAPFSSISHTRSAALSMTTPMSAPTARTSRPVSSSAAEMSSPRRLALESTKAFRATISTPRSPTSDGMTSEAAEKL